MKSKEIEKSFIICSVLYHDYCSMILNYISNNSGCSINMISASTKIDIRQISRTLIELKNIKAIKIIKRNNKNYCYDTGNIYKFIDAIQKFK